MSHVISDTNCDIDQKIKTGQTPHDEDKKKLQHRIKQLDKKQHLYLFHNIVKNIEGGTMYTMTDTGIYFDLDDFTPKDFWTLYYHTNLFYDCISRNKVFEEAVKLDATKSQSLIYTGQTELDTTSMFEDYCRGDEDGEEERDADAKSDHKKIELSYEVLRLNAVNECKYSKYQKVKSEEIRSRQNPIGATSKAMDKNVYTDQKHIPKI